MPATYEVRGGVAYPPRVKYEGALCPECKFRGRHMTWCSRSTTAAPVLAPSACRPEAPFPAKVIPIRSATTAAPAKRRGGLPQDELDRIEAEIAWATAKGWTEVDRFRKLLVRNAKRRVAYLADRIHERPVFLSDVQWYSVNGASFEPTTPPTDFQAWASSHAVMFTEKAGQTPAPKRRTTR